MGRVVIRAQRSSAPMRARTATAPRAAAALLLAGCQSTGGEPPSGAMAGGVAGAAAGLGAGKAADGGESDVRPHRSGNGMNSCSSPGTMAKRRACQSALAASIRSLEEATKFHQM